MLQSTRLNLLLAGSAMLVMPGFAVAQNAPAPAPVATLVRQVSIPHQVFTLANGLTVVVHEDRKAPVVAVSVWYNVGSKDEPAGKTGFAHLFEHLMFNGSENLPGDSFTYLQQVGATDTNGSTYFDRTNYYETVPRGALEKTLFLESDRMGFLLGGITQDKLDNQRGVVQNEKRQGDNAPGGLVEYEILKSVFPAGHPYRHSTIGSMSDLDRASLKDVQDWFRQKYAPSNAVLVLAGDISAAAARPLVEKYFGGIARGPANVPALASVPTLKPGRTLVMKDRVAATSITRVWAVPGMLSKDLAALDIGGSILGGLGSSRLDRILVRDEKVLVSVLASNESLHRVGMFTVRGTVRPGVSVARAEQRIDAVVADFIARGPTAAEVRRAATAEVADQIRGLEEVSGKAEALAEGQLYAKDADFYRRTLAAYAAVTPAQIRTTMQHWLGRPAFKLRLEPGDRPAYEETKFVPRAGAVEAGTPPPSTRRVIPEVDRAAALEFPAVQRATLSNGITVTYAQRRAVPVTQMALVFDAGSASDSATTRGLQGMTLGLLDEGAGGLDSQAIAERQEEIGAKIGSSISTDLSQMTLSALSANLAPSLDLLQKVVEQPTFAAGDIERVRTQLLTTIAQNQRDPNQIAARALPSLLYGAGHPYATRGVGDAAAVKGFSRGDIVGFQQRWLRPDNLSIFVVSDLPLTALVPQIEARFGTWAVPAVAKGTKAFGALPPRPTKQRIVLIDRPNSPQSVIYGGEVTPIDPRGDIVPVQAAGEVLGGNFLSRMNTDLRETKGWSYGVSGTVQAAQHALPFIIRAPVQADRTGESIAALNTNIGDFLGAKGVTAEELSRLVSNNVDGLTGRFETGSAVLQALIGNALYGRPDDYYERLAGKYRGLTPAGLDGALRGAVDPNAIVWVVVGDAAKVRPQLEKLGLPIEVMAAR